MKKVTVWITVVSLFCMFTFVACDKSADDNAQPLGSRGLVGTLIGSGQIGTKGTGPTAGQTLRQQVYMDSVHLVVLMQQLTPDQIIKVQANGQPMGIIYVYGDLHQPSTFLPVTPGFVGPDENPYWQVMQITFNPGIEPRQFTYATQVEDAVLAGDITLTPTGDVYWYEVIAKY